jgi:hypothetical protein
MDPGGFNRGRSTYWVITKAITGNSTMLSNNGSIALMPPDDSDFEPSFLSEAGAAMAWIIV